MLGAAAGCAFLMNQNPGSGGTPRTPAPQICWHCPGMVLSLPHLTPRNELPWGEGGHAHLPLPLPHKRGGGQIARSHRWVSPPHGTCSRSVRSASGSLSLRRPLSVLHAPTWFQRGNVQVQTGPTDLSSGHVSVMSSCAALAVSLNFSELSGSHNSADASRSLWGPGG